jgi:hypothetical protein
MGAITKSLNLLVGIPLAALILFEEWMWEPLRRFSKACSRLRFIRWLSLKVSSLSPRQAVATFLIPIIVLFPFKVGGLWLIGRGHALLGVVVFLLAKVLGTALFAWLFDLTRQALLQVSWFAFLHERMQAISTRAHNWIHQQAIYRATKGLINNLRRAWKSFIDARAKTQ